MHSHKCPLLKLPRLYRSHRTVWPALAAAFLLASCGESAPPEGDTLLRLEAVVVDTIRGAEDGPSSLSQIRAIAVDDMGRLYVADGIEKAVKVFNSDGSFVRTLGRSGEGPGEFNTPQGIAIGPEQRAFVYDPIGRRVVVFDSAGAFVETTKIDRVSYGYAWEGGVDSAGNLVDQQMLRVDTASVRYVRRLNLQSGATDTLPQPSCADIAPYFQFERGSAMVPFGAGEYLWFDAKAGGTWCADRARAVAWFIPFGDSLPRDSLVSAATPAPVLAAEREAATARLDSFVNQIGAERPDYGRIPPVKPVFMGLDRDERGRLWMAVIDESGPAMHVFRSDGQWIARVALPTPPIERLHPAVFKDRLYRITMDEMGVPVVEVLSVAMPE